MADKTLCPCAVGNARFHPLFNHVLRRATKQRLELGEISQEQADQVESVIETPWRKSVDGEIVDVLSMVRYHTIALASADPTLDAITRLAVFRVGFDWQSIKDWVISHLPQILSCLASILTIFCLFL